MKGKKIVVAVMPYLVVVLLTIGILFCLYGEIDINRPIVYAGDGVSATYLMKTIDETGWFSFNPHTGGYFGGDFSDYTMCDNGSFLLVKFISLFTNNCFLIFNLFYFLTFILISLTSLFTLKRLKVDVRIATVFSLLYSFLAYHQMRTPHIWLTPYFMVPLSILVAIWIAAGEYKFDCLTWKGICKSKKVWFSAIVLFFSAFTGFYYAFFTCCTICIAGVISLMNGVSLKKIVGIVGGLFAVVLGILANVYPSLIYWAQNGMNAESELAIRSVSDPEVYGMKLIQLLLPSQSHRMSALADIANGYINNIFPAVNENITVTLGFIGSIGFVLLLFALFRKNEKNRYESVLKQLNIGVFMIATLGGVGALFSYIISTPMRAYNRFSIYIAFFAFVYLGIFLTDKVVVKCNTIVKNVICIVLCIMLIFIGIYDQTCNYVDESQQAANVDFDSDKEFVEQIEATMPEGAMIYQLPYVKFPSYGHYDLYKGYMHSKNLIWSYGAMQGREEDHWESVLQNYSLPDRLHHICIGGYEGIYIDTSIYAELYGNTQQVINFLITQLGQQPVYSSNEKLAFFDLREYAEKFKDQYSEKQFEQMKKDEYTLDSNIKVSYGGGFYNEEVRDDASFKWCQKRGTITIQNMGKAAKYTLSATVNVIEDKTSNFRVKINDGEITKYKIPAGGDAITIELDLQEGENIIKFSNSIDSIVDENDGRTLNFMLVNPSITEVR